MASARTPPDRSRLTTRASSPATDTLGRRRRSVLARVRQREHERVPARTGAPVRRNCSSTFVAAGPKARSERSVRMRSRRSPAALVEGIRPIGSTVVTSARPGDACRPRRNQAPSGVPTVASTAASVGAATRSTLEPSTENRGPGVETGPGIPARSHASRRGAPTAVSSTIGRVGWTRTGRVRVAVRRGSAMPSVSATRPRWSGAVVTLRCRGEPGVAEGTRRQDSHRGEHVRRRRELLR